MSKTVLLSVSDPEALDRELEAQGGRVAVRLPGNLVVARVPESFEATRSKTFRLAAGAKLHADAERSVRAFDESRAILGSNPPGHGLKWDAPGFKPPRFEEAGLGALSENDQRSTGTSTSIVMTAGIAVGLVVVSGPSSNLKFSESEIDKVYSECLAALDYLSGANPEAGIRFTIEMNPVSITAQPLAQSCGNSAEPCEAVFRDPALAVLGYPASSSGSRQYAQALQQQTGESWGYVAYFTKYPTYWFAYAGGERVVMQYSNDGWGPDNIHRVFAHESCHIFGAADEYGSCTCGGSHGYFGAPNNNCVNCKGEHFECLMDGNQLVLCTWSRRQIGWNAWSAQTKVTDQNSAKTSSAPALAQYGGQVWMAYRGEASSDLWAAPYDGTKWGAQTKITDQNGAKSSTAVGLSAYGSNLWMAFKGEGSSNLYACPFDGTKWGAQTKITDQNGAKSSTTPALAELGGKLWMAFRGEGSSNLYVCTFDGSKWGAPTKLTDVNGAKTSTAPALASFGGKLWLAYRGESSADLWACSYDGSKWSAQTKITDINGAKTSVGPRLGALGNLLWMAYRGEASSNMWSCAYNGTTWLAQTEITVQNGAKTSNSIGLAPLPDKLVAAYRGESSSDIWSCYLQADANVT